MNAIAYATFSCQCYPFSHSIATTKISSRPVEVQVDLLRSISEGIHQFSVWLKLHPFWFRSIRLEHCDAMSKERRSMKRSRRILCSNVRIVSFQDGPSCRHRRILGRDSNAKFSAPCDQFVSWSMNERGVGLVERDDGDRSVGDRSKTI